MVISPSRWSRAPENLAENYHNDRTFHCGVIIISAILCYIIEMIMVIIWRHQRQQHEHTQANDGKWLRQIFTVSSWNATAITNHDSTLNAIQLSGFNLWLRSSAATLQQFTIKMLLKTLLILRNRSYAIVTLLWKDPDNQETIFQDNHMFRDWILAFQGNWLGVVLDTEGYCRERPVTPLPTM